MNKYENKQLKNRNCTLKVEPETVEKERYTRAEKVSWTEYLGDCIYDVTSNKFFRNIGDMEDYYRDLSSNVPSYVYAGKIRDFSLDIESIINNYLERKHYEDACHDVIDINELMDFTDKWCKKQTIKTYVVDYSKVVLLD